MKFASQPDLPFPKQIIRSPRPIVRARPAVRVVVGQAVLPRDAERRRPLVIHAGRPAMDPGRRELPAAAGPVPVPSFGLGGKSFAGRRIRHAIETTGSCMLIALFFVLFLFG